MKSIFIALFTLLCLTTTAQWGQDYLSSSRIYCTAGLYNDTIFFVGGDNGSLSSVVDVFDVNAQTWAPSTNVSVGKGYAATVGGDSALYVAGGVTSFGSTIVGSDIIDIYKNGIWSTYTMPESNFLGQAVHVGSKIIFFGGMTSFSYDGLGNADPVFSDLIIVYDELTNTLNTLNNINPRSDMAVATDGNIAIFAGGYNGQNSTSDVVNIYNASTDSWSTAQLSESRMQAGATYCNGKFYIGGGTNNSGLSSSTIDIFDGVNWTTDNLSSPRSAPTALTVGDIVIFAGGGDLNFDTYIWQSYSSDVDVLNTTTGMWTTNSLNIIRANASGVSTNGKAYIASGASTDVVEIWDVPLGITTLSTNQEKELVDIVDLLGRKTQVKQNTPLIYIYSDGSKERVFHLIE